MPTISEHALTVQSSEIGLVTLCTCIHHMTRRDVYPLQVNLKDSYLWTASGDLKGCKELMKKVYWNIV